MNYARRLWTAIGLAAALCSGSAWGQFFILGGRVTDGPTGIGLVTITAVGQTIGQTFSTSTDVTGNYALTLSQGTYSVSAARLNTDFLPVDCLLRLSCPTNVVVTIGPDRTNVDFSVVYSVGGRVTEGASVLRGVRVSVQSPFLQTTLTDLTGNYLLNGLQRGQYVVTPTLTGYTFEPPNLSVAIPTGTNVNFSGFAAFSITGAVKSGGAGFAGVNVTLQGPTGSVSATTDPTGSFAFANLAHATYTVTPSLQGYSFSPASVTTTGPTNIAFQVATLSMNGRVTDGVNGISGVQVEAIQGTNTVSTQTDGTGRYAFGDLAGTYTIKPTKAGQTFNPARRTLSVGVRTDSINFVRAATAVDTLVTTCDEPSLKLALSLGGSVGFDCGTSAPAVELDEPIAVSTNVSLLGGTTGATVSGNGVPLFSVRPGIGFTIQNLFLTDGLAAGADGTNGTAGEGVLGGAIFNDHGTVALSNTTLRGNQAAGGAGGVGITTLEADSLDGGAGGSAFGGAIYNDGGTLLLTNCVFTGNAAIGGAGGQGADASTLFGSHDGGDGGIGGAAAGGAVYSVLGTVVAVDCTFSNNVVNGALGGTGGAGNGGLGFPGVNGAPGSAGGGAIFSSGGLVNISFDTIASNAVVGADGLAGAAGGSGSSGEKGGNGSAAGGGGVLNLGGVVSATNCTFYANAVTGGAGGVGGAGGTFGFGGNGGDGGAGGGGNGGGLLNQGGNSTLIAVTFSKNVATGGAGGAGGAAGTSLATAGKSGSAGRADGGAVANMGGTVTIRNTIVAYGAPGNNSFGVITDGGNNLSSDATPLFTSSTSTNSVDPLLANLANNGGPTFTAALSASSPAINSGDLATSSPVDQRHFARTGRGDIGAFEFGAQLLKMSVVRVGGDIVISWPATALGYRLQITPSLSPMIWQDATNIPVVVNSNYVVTNAVGLSNDFYRLVQ